MVLVFSYKQTPPSTPYQRYDPFFNSKRSEVTLLSRESYARPFTPVNLDISNSQQRYTSSEAVITRLCTRTKMRLINTSTIKLHDFFGKVLPPYAILSHRWESAEVTFQDLRDGRGPKLEGWKKVTGCCAKAAADGWEYLVSSSLCCLISYAKFETLNCGGW